MKFIVIKVGKDIETFYVIDMREMMVPVWKIDDKNIPDDVKEKAIETIRSYKSNDQWWADDESLTGVECLTALPKYWDIGYTQSGNFIQFEFDLDNDAIREWLEIPKSVWDKVEVDIENGERDNTTIIFEQESYDVFEYLSECTDEHPWVQMTDNYERLYYWDLEILEKAKEKFDKAMDKALDNLEKSYEYSISDECCIEDAIANEWEFDNDGNMV